MSNFLWETSWHGRNLQTSADYWDTQYFLFWQKFHDQSFCSDCEKTEHESTFLKLSVDSALSIDFKNGLIFENWQFDSWPMSKNLYNWFLSCTIFHVTFWNSDRVFLIVLVKILIFSCKKSVHVEIQLWVLLKFWLSPGLMKKEKKIFGSDWGLNWGLLIESQVFIPRDQRGSYRILSRIQYLNSNL